MLFLPKPENMLIKWLRLLVASFFILLIVFLIILAAYLIFEENYKNRIYPNVKLGNINLGGMTRSEARMIIEKRINEISQNGVKFNYQKNETTITPIISSLEGDIAYQIIFFDSQKTMEKAFDFGRSEGIIKDIFNKAKALKNGFQVSAEVKIENEEIKKILNENYEQFEQIGKDALLTATTSKRWARKIEFYIEEEQVGYKFNYDSSLEKLNNNLKKLDNSPIEIDVQKDYPSIFKRECLNIENKAPEIADLAPFNLSYEDKRWEVKKEIFIEWLKLSKDNNGKVFIDISDEKIKEFLEKTMAKEINQEAVDARFEINEGRVVEFKTNKDGLKLNFEKTTEEIRIKLLGEKNKEIFLVVETEKSKISTENINDLGIKEIIGTGHSNFVGSPTNRILNIKNGASSTSGVLIKPDEEFSLIKTLGKIDADTGYLPELVIRGNKTVPEYGGGLCQIGTTFFRAALTSGLPITARRSHSYRVSYYEPAGTDATIYDPSPDLKFINDTGNYILIISRIDGNDLYFDFWGTKDGRIVEKTDPTIYNIVKPGPTKIIETLDLPVGQKKCTEKPHNGADAYFDYKVTYSNGEIKEKKFESHYVPWREVCLLGVENLSTTTPETL